jgi:hypothetical protein
MMAIDIMLIWSLLHVNNKTLQLFLIANMFYHTIGYMYNNHTYNFTCNSQ